MRNPSASTKPSLNDSPTCVTIASPNDGSCLQIADVRQHLFAEQFESLHQRAQVTRTGGLEHQIDDAGADLVATAFDLFDDRVRTAKEIRRQCATHPGGPRFAGDIAGVEPRKSLADAGLQWEGISPHCPRFQQTLSFFVGLGQQDIRSIDDLLRHRLPTILRTEIPIVAGRLAHHVERAIGEAEAEAVPCRDLAGFTTTAEGVGRWMRVLQWPRPNRDRAELVMTTLPAKGLRLGPGFEDQLHRLGRTLTCFGRIETVAQVLARDAAQQAFP